MKNFKRYYFLLFSVAVLGFTSCIEQPEDLGELRVDLDINNLILKVDSGASGETGVVLVLDTGVNTGAADLIEKAGGNPDAVSRVEVERIYLTVVEPDGRNFDPIKSVVVKVFNPNNENDKIDFIPEGTTLPRGVNEVETSTTNENVVRLLTSPDIQLEIGVDIIDGVVITEDMIISMDIKCVAVTELL